MLLNVIAVTLFCVASAGHFELKTSRHHVPASGKNQHNLRLNSAGVPVESAIHNILYKFNITVGTPKQLFSIIMDTGSSRLWIPHLGCELSDGEAENCPDKRVYDESKSSTYTKTDDVLVIHYGIGSTKGKFVKDVFSFGDLTTTEFKFKNAIEFGAGDQISHRDIGILGLCFMPAGQAGTSIMQEMVDENLLDAPIFTVYYKRCEPYAEECSDGGVITFGSEDKKNCGKILGYTETIDKAKSHWQFTLEEMSVGNFKYTGRPQTITDSGSSHLFIGRKAHDGIVKELKAEETRQGSGIYAVKCSQKVEITIVINGIKYTIPMTSLVREISEGWCQLLIYPNKSEDEVFILGDPWVRSYCQVHDWKAGKVGFAEVLNPQSFDPTTDDDKKGDGSFAKWNLPNTVLVMFLVVLRVIW